jgi:hypothetical protein
MKWTGSLEVYHVSFSLEMPQEGHPSQTLWSHQPYVWKASGLVGSPYPEKRQEIDPLV